MGRPKLCDNKLRCKLKDQHEGACDFGLNDVKISEKSELEILQADYAALKLQLENSSESALRERVAKAEFEMARYQEAVRTMADGAESGGLTVIAAMLRQLFDKV